MNLASIKEIVPEIGSNRQSDRLGQILTLQQAGSGHDYHRFHASPLLRSNAHILGLPFEF